MNLIKSYFLSFLFLLVFCMQTENVFALNTDSGPVFFIGEDIIHPKGMVISVNEISKKPFYGGLGNSVPKEDLIINITLLNNGYEDQTVNVNSDFSLDMGEHHYLPLEDEFSRVKVEEVVIGANTQSRIDLTFRVVEGEKATPELLFTFLGSVVRIVCDEQLGKIVTNSDGYASSKEEVAKAAKLLIDAGRLSAAKGLCEGVLMRYPNDSQILLLMAKIYSEAGDNEQTAFYIRKIETAKMSNAEEAEEVANMALGIDYSDVAIKVLEPFYSSGLLNEDQQFLLARAYYYENQLKPSTDIISYLIGNGYNNYKAFFTMGNIYNKKYDYEQAVAYWEKAVEFNPEYSEALFNLGVGYYKLGNVSKARDYWRKVIKSNPDHRTLSVAKTALDETKDD